MDDQTRAIILGVVRHFVGIGGTYLAAHGVMVSGSDMDMISGAVLAIGAVGWSWYQKTTVVAKKVAP